jgi:hypothetical protein
MAPAQQWAIGGIINVWFVSDVKPMLKLAREYLRSVIRRARLYAVYKYAILYFFLLVHDACKTAFTTLTYSDIQ